jgi:hypothetical protein
MPTRRRGIGEVARAGLAALLGVGACGGETPEAPPRGVGQVRVATIVDLGGPGTDVTTIDASFQRAQLTLEDEDGSFTQVLLPDANGAYSFGDETGVFEPGDPVSVRFAGGEVPAFDVSGLFPEPLLVTEPVVPSGSDPYRVSRGSDLTFRWTGGIAGTTLSVSQDSASSTLLRCNAPSERGSLTVPASALATLDEGQLDLRTVTAVWAEAGSYDVVLVLTAAALNADGQGIVLTLEP